MAEENNASGLYDFPMYLGLIVMDISKAEYFVFGGIAQLEGHPDHLQPDRVTELYEEFQFFTGKSGSLTRFRNMVIALGDDALTAKYEKVHSRLCEVSKKRGSHVHRMWMCYTPSKEHFETMYKGQRDEVSLKEIRELSFEVRAAADAMAIFVLSEIWSHRRRLQPS